MNTQLFNVRDILVIGIFSLLANMLFSKVFAAVDAKTGDTQ